ncbi:uncharacterized protein LOC108104245 [Drosophila eugracilis]|uniref:uncharacterized protein LOC108104245 n=1 Tax=Drosophila eugracilis TaxID=29029 RepID=UPI0007E85E6A|nr:uncharacterized protein LOC108104245 [Drosophila eugracilis]
MYKRENGFKPWLLDTKFDACRFMRRQYDPFAKLVYSFFQPFTNINHTCPFEGPQILQGFYLKPELLLLPFPTGQYMLAIRWYFDKKLQFDTNVAVVFKMTNFECASYNKSWFVFHNYRLKALSRDKVILNMNGTILQPAYRIQAHFKIYKRENGFKPWLLDSKIDACRFMRRKYDHFVKIVYSLFEPFSNINHTCPYVGPQIVEGFYLKPELLLLPFPTGQYMLAIRWYFDKKLQFDTNVSFLFVEDFGKSR